MENLHLISLFSVKPPSPGLAVVGAALIFFIPAVSGAGKGSPAAKQAEAQKPGYLLIVRSANLGTIVAGVEIDGKQTARINFGGGYNRSELRRNAFCRAPRIGSLRSNFMSRCPAEPSATLH